MSKNKTFIPVEMAYNRVDAKFGALTWAVHQSQDADEALVIIDELISRLSAMAETVNRYKDNPLKQAG